MSVTSIELGTISIVPKGEWSSELAYVKNNLVSNSGNSYVALQSVPAGTLLSNTSYWMLSASIGATGATGQSAYEAAVAGGYADTQTNFYADLAAMEGLADLLATI